MKIGNPASPEIPGIESMRHAGAPSPHAYLRTVDHGESIQSQVDEEFGQWLQNHATDCVGDAPSPTRLTPRHGVERRRSPSEDFVGTFGFRQGLGHSRPSRFVDIETPTGTCMRTDAELIRAFAESRDEAAFEEFVRRHAGMVQRVCRRIMANDADADDALQATLFVLARRATQVCRRGDPIAWLHKTARLVALEAVRARTRRRRREDMVMSRTTEGPTPLAEAQRRQALDRLDDALERLPPEQREAIILRHLEGRSQAECALLVGCPEGTLAWRLSKGIEALRERLGRRGCALETVALVAILESEIDGLHKAGGPTFPSIDVLLRRPPHPSVEALTAAVRRRDLVAPITALALTLAAALAIALLFAKDGSARSAAPEQRRGPAVLGGAPAAAELLGFRRNAEGALLATGTPIRSPADGIVRYLGRFTDPTRRTPETLIVVEHVAGSTVGALCALFYFEGEAAPSLEAGLAVSAGATLGTVGGQAGAARAHAWFAAHGGAYAQMTSGFEKRWRHDALALAAEAGFPDATAERIKLTIVADDAVEARFGDHLIVSIALLRSFCGPAESAAPLADWCFSDDDDPNWRDPKPIFFELRAR